MEWGRQQQQHGLVLIKMLILHLFVSHLKFPCNVVVELLTLLRKKIRLRLGGYLHAIIRGVFESFPVGLSARFLHIFLNYCMQIMNMGMLFVFVL